jgi:long-chain fatty acid transport protein
MQPRWKNVPALGILAGSLVLPVTLLQGAGFALHEHSVSGLGVGFASGAAGGSDNSAMFFNPAALTLFGEPEITAGFHWILPDADFTNTGTVTGFIPGVSPGVPTQGADSSSDRAALVPNIFYSRPLNDQWYLGFGVSTPYGLATDYDAGWVGRYVAKETDLATINSNLAFGYKVSDRLSLGFGVNVLYGDAILSNAINFGLAYLNGLNNGTIPANAQTQALAQDVQANLGGTKYDGFLELEGDDFGYGFNLGLLYALSEDTRVGLHYRSKVALELSGEADFTVGQLDAFFGPLFVDQGGKVDLDLPDTAQISVHHQVTPRWAVMADIFYTWWSKFDELVIEYETGFPADSVIPENWDDTWRYSVGTTYQLNDQVELRAGLVFDQSGVTSDEFRSPRIPDEDRTWIALGLGYHLNDALRLDVAYSHIFVDDPVIDNPTHTAGEWLRGTMNASVNILSLSGTFQF